MADADFGPVISPPVLQKEMQAEWDKLQKGFEKKKAFLETLMTIFEKNEELHKKLTAAKIEFGLLLVDTQTKCEEGYAAEFLDLLKAELTRMQSLEPKTP